MKVYISGKISGENPEEVALKFRSAEGAIRKMGHEPVSPLNNGLPDDASWEDHMAADIAMLLRCQAIYLLDDWNTSRGARIEAEIAIECKMEILYQKSDIAWVDSRLNS